MITVAQYFMGRDSRYPKTLTLVIKTNAALWVHRVSQLLALAAADGVEPGIDEVTGNFMASGWRPPEVNDRTANAAATSTHLTGEGGDLQENGSGRPLARWCLRNLDKLAAIGLWMENPQWTPTWVHLQTKPPKSGNRVYIPSTAPAKAPPLPEQAK